MRTIRAYDDDIDAAIGPDRRTLPAFARQRTEDAGAGRVDLDVMFDGLREAMSTDPDGKDVGIALAGLPRVVGKIVVPDDARMAGAAEDASLNRLLQAMSTFGAGSEGEGPFRHGRPAMNEENGLFAVNASI